MELIMSFLMCLLFIFVSNLILELINANSKKNKTTTIKELAAGFIAMVLFILVQTILAFYKQSFDIIYLRLVLYYVSYFVGWVISKTLLKKILLSK